MKKHIHLFQILISGVALFAPILGVTGQTTITIPASKDNTIYSESGSLSDGKGIYLYSGQLTQSADRRRALLAFDVADIIPAGATIQEVSLSMTVSKAKTSSGAGVALYKVNADWGESASDGSANGGKGASAKSGDATWTHRFFDSQQWTAEGGDFEATSSAGKTIGGEGTYTWTSTTNLVSDVQSWLDNPLTNFGWILIGAEGTPSSVKKFHSLQSTTEANRPVLSVTYLGPTGISDQGTPDKGLKTIAYPNPFSENIQFLYRLHEPKEVTLEILNILGQRIRLISTEKQASGVHTLQWDGKNESGNVAGTGVYYAALYIGDSKQLTKILKTR